jgi:Tol biopolymer transport system component
VQKLFLLVASLPVLTTSSFAQGSATAKIAFSSNRDGDFAIYVMNADGPAVTQLTTNSAHDYQPVWSP